MADQTRRPMRMPSSDMRYSSMNMGANRKAAQQEAPPVNQAPPVHKNPQASDEAAKKSGGIFDLLSTIKLDEEKILIIFILIILARNGAELPILAALGYLLM